MPALVTITGPIASGKNTAAALFAEHCTRAGLTVVIADVDMAAMVAAPGQPQPVWLAAHEAHGALVARWMLTDVDMVISVGPLYTQAEQDALYGPAGPWGSHWCRRREDEAGAPQRYGSLFTDVPADLDYFWPQPDDVQARAEPAPGRRLWAVRPESQLALGQFITAGAVGLGTGSSIDHLDLDLDNSSAPTCAGSDSRV